MYPRRLHHFSRSLADYLRDRLFDHPWNRGIGGGMTFYICIGKWARPAFRFSWRIREARLCLGFVAVCIGMFDVEETTINLLNTIKAQRGGEE